jgi:hypothetical protein
MKQTGEIGIIGMPALKREMFTRVILTTAIHDAVMMPICVSKAPEPAEPTEPFPSIDLSDIIKPFPRPMNRRERRRASRLKK